MDEELDIVRTFETSSHRFDCPLAYLVARPVRPVEFDVVQDNRLAVVVAIGAVEV